MAKKSSEKKIEIKLDFMITEQDLTMLTLGDVVELKCHAITAEGRSLSSKKKEKLSLKDDGKAVVKMSQATIKTEKVFRLKGKAECRLTKWQIWDGEAEVTVEVENYHAVHEGDEPRQYKGSLKVNSLVNQDFTNAFVGYGIELDVTTR
jgi:hypothetical protein